MCVTPYITEDKTGKKIAVPCGHCLQCLKDYQKQWSFRLTQECKRTSLPLFVTLTYNDEHLPLGEDDDGNIQSILVKSDLQNFMKRLRRYQRDLTKDCRYFAVGEYGSKKNRCHWHLVLICPNIQSWIYPSRRLTMRKLHDAIKKAWILDGKEIGFIKVEYCDEEQIKYVTKYLNKLDRRPHLVKPCRLMSKSIGLNFLSHAMVNYYLSTFDRTVLNGKVRINMPRYYRQKLNEYSHKHWMLKRAGLTYSDLVAPPKFEDNSLRSLVARAQKDFCDNFDEYYRQCVAHIAYQSRKYGFQFYEPNRNEVYQFVVKSNHDLQDAIRISNDTLNKVCIQNELITYKEITLESAEYG